MVDLGSPSPPSEREDAPKHREPDASGDARRGASIEDGSLVACFQQVKGPAEGEVVARHNLVVAGRSLGRLRADRPLVSPSCDLGGEAPVAERGDDEPAARVGGIRLGMAGTTERD